MRANSRNGRKFQPRSHSLEARAAVSVVSIGGLLESFSVMSSPVMQA